MVEEVTVFGSEGQVQILSGHAPIVGTLETGFFHYRLAGGQELSGVISSGFFRVQDDVVTILAETIELRGEVDVSRAKKAQKEAEEVLRQADLDQHAFGKYQLKLERSIIRQQLAEKS